MNILLTGGTGYLGSMLCERLVALGHGVTALVRQAASSSSLVTLRESAGERLELVELDSADLENELGTKSFDLCIHGATRYGRPPETEEDVRETNFEFAKRVYQMSARIGIKSFVNLDTPIPPEVSAYARYKRDFRTFLRADEAIPQRINIVLQYIYGESEPQGRLVRSLVEVSYEQNGAFPMSPGEQRRDFIHIDDVVAAFESLVSSLSELPNGFTQLDLGTGSAVSLRELVALIQNLNPKSSADFQFGALPYRSGEPMEVKADNAYLKTVFGWAPRVSLEEGIARVVNVVREGKGV
ncbi:MAG: NAD(P)-dependent oxidoreductase [Bdellovibrionales bacterium]|nr:NAD(P)-dependent oxidoreductase [Bdellovibrionales bacterium]